MTGSASRARVAALSVAFLLPLVAQAHPHLWIDAQAEVVFDAQGRVAAIRQIWSFDEMFGFYAIQGLPQDAQGAPTPAARGRMAADWMQALGEPVSHYFTHATYQGRSLAFMAPSDSSVQWDPEVQRLSLSFTLPLVTPMAPGAEGLQIDIFDPTYFVAYAFDTPNAWRLVQAPAQCLQTYRSPQAPDWKTLQQLAAIPAEIDALPDELLAITKGLTHRIEVRCS